MHIRTHPNIKIVIVHLDARRLAAHAPAVLIECTDGHRTHFDAVSLAADDFTDQMALQTLHDAANAIQREAQIRYDGHSVRTIKNGVIHTDAPDYSP